MVRSMLDISRLQSTGEEIKKARFDVTEALGRTLLTFEQKIEEKHLDVQVDMPEKAVYVMANEDAITQVIYNLIDNGVKFAKDGTPFLLTVATSGGKALVSVANSGPTIPPEELPLVFDDCISRTRAAPWTRPAWGWACILSRPFWAATERIFPSPAGMD